MRGPIESAEAYAQLGRTQLGLRLPELPAVNRARALAKGLAVPTGPSNVAPVEVTRGSFAHVSLMACAHCPSVLEVRELPKPNLGYAARANGWTNSRSSVGWICPACTAEFGGAA